MSQATSPSMLQYLSFKEQYRDSLLLFRMGDFYELFYEDAVTASRVLDIVLTSRDKDKENGIPMAGIPHHALESYLPRLLEAGHKVAIAEQMEDSRQAKGLVRRDVVQVVTPGTITTPTLLDARDNCYLVSCVAGRDRSGDCLGLAFADLSTGEFQLAELRASRSLEEQASSLLFRLRPRELLLLEGSAVPSWLSKVRDELGSVQSFRPAANFELVDSRKVLLEHFGVSTLEGFGIEGSAWGLRAAGGLVAYLRETQKRALPHMRRIRVHDFGEAMGLDPSTQTNLELCRSLRDGGRAGTVLSILDQTRTPMGARLLKSWLLAPLVKLEAIEDRLSAVQELRDSALLTQELAESLSKMSDLERLASRVALGNVRGRDLASLRASLDGVGVLKGLMERCFSPLLVQLASQIDSLEDLGRLLWKAVAEDPPQTPKEGGLIRDGYSDPLDELRRMAKGSQGELLRFEAEEREKTGIAKLKVTYNKVFGYFIEVRKSQGDKIPDRYIRKQTLLNVERYVTEELIHFADRLAHAEEQAQELEIRLFEELRQTLAGDLERIHRTAAALAQLDVLVSFAQVSARRGYCRPDLHEGSEILLQDARHPVVEAMQGVDYVPSDLRLEAETEQILLITGPNMAGKSTAMRMVALVVIFAQVGMFVPARSARIGLVDRIFTRVGASDSLARGLSTFMVEMSETANILHHCTDRSFILLDEIGRGTSTFDGLAIAWSVVEYLHGKSERGPRTLFATHYHELTALTEELPRIRNYHIAVQQWREQLLFLRKLSPGPASQSYGIEVARLAGIPVSVIERAKQVLEKLEQVQKHQPWIQPNPQAHRQLELFGEVRQDWMKELARIDVNQLTPLGALNRLSEIVAQARELEGIV